MSFETSAKIKRPQTEHATLRLRMICSAAAVMGLAVGTPLQALNLGGGGVGVGVDVSVGGGGIGVGVGVDVGDIEVDAEVEVGGGGTGGGGTGGGGTGGGGTGGGGTGGGGTGGGGTGTDGSDDTADGSDANGGAGRQGGRMSCAGGGNATAYNGFVVRDRDGDAIGWVHDTTIGPDQKIRSVKMQSNGRACYSLVGGTFRLTGEEVWINVDGGKFR